MKRLIVTGALMLSMIFTLSFASNAAASGRAAGLLISTTSGSAVALMDFNEAQFTQVEAQNLTALLQVAVPLAQQFLSGQMLGIQVTVFTPSQMTGFGLGDADKANDFILNNLPALGMPTYIKVVVTKVAPPQGVTGQNIRLDLYFLEESTLGYLGSLEVQEQLINQLSGFLTF